MLVSRRRNQSSTGLRVVSLGQARRRAVASSLLIAQKLQNTLLRPKAPPSAVVTRHGNFSLSVTNKCEAMEICFRLLTHEMRRAFSLANASAGRSNAA